MVYKIHGQNLNSLEITIYKIHVTSLLQHKNLRISIVSYNVYLITHTACIESYIIGVSINTLLEKRIYVGSSIQDVSINTLSKNRMESLLLKCVYYYFILKSDCVSTIKVCLQLGKFCPSIECLLLQPTFYSRPESIWI